MRVRTEDHVREGVSVSAPQAKAECRPTRGAELQPLRSR
jgi:hypothetical protein